MLLHVVAVLLPLVVNAAPSTCHTVADLDRVLLDLGVSAATCSKLLQQLGRVLAFALAAPSGGASILQQYQTAMSSNVLTTATLSSASISNSAIKLDAEATRLAAVAFSVNTHARAAGLQLSVPAYEAAWDIQALSGEY